MDIWGGISGTIYIFDQRYFNILSGLTSTDAYFRGGKFGFCFAFVAAHAAPLQCKKDKWCTASLIPSAGNQNVFCLKPFSSPHGIQKARALKNPQNTSQFTLRERKAPPSVVNFLLNLVIIPTIKC